MHSQIEGILDLVWGGRSEVRCPNRGPPGPSLPMRSSFPG